MRLQTTGTIREQIAERYPVYQRAFSRSIRAIANFVVIYGWTVFIAVTVACACIRFGQLSARRLDHDELFTFTSRKRPAWDNC